MSNIKKQMKGTLNKAKNSVKKSTKKIKEKTKNKNKLLIFFVSLGIIAASVILVFALYIIISAPDFNTTKLYNKEATVLYYANGEELARVGSENRVLITYDDLPQVFVDALVATEDSRFFQHNGFDAARFLKASINQALGKNAGGASTLTMQVVKNTYTNSKVSIIRKFTDIYMAVFKIERVYTKEEIIEFYVNSLWLGYGGANYDSINGVEQASQNYFGKSVSDLSLPEASLLVAMFNNPAYYNPIKNPENAKSRQKTVLSLMVKHGYITEEEAKNAGDIPIESLIKTNTNDNTKVDNGNQAFIEYVLEDVEKKTSVDPTKTPMAIYTTLDKNIQNVVTSLEKGEIYTFVDDLVQNGIAITSTKDGSILALGGGRNFIKTGTNRATDIKRQPGSTAKPIFDYGPFIEYNNGSTGTTFYDNPYTYSNGIPITNYDNRYKGTITMRDALIDSRNVPALQAFQAVDKDKIAEFAHNLGIDYGDNLYESASIGGFDGVNPLQMSAAYAAFGREGYFIEPYSFTKIIYLENDEEFNYKYTKVRVMSEETAYMITDMLVDGGASGVGGSIKVSGTDVAAKGGTTTIDKDKAKKLGIPNYATPDHWNNVYTPDYSISLWYGYDDYYKSGGKYITSSTGGTARRKIMAAVANKVLKTNSKFTKPSGVIEAVIEFGSNPLKLAGPYTPDYLKRTELFKKGTEPAEASIKHTNLPNPTNGNALVNGSSITLTWDAIQPPETSDEAWGQLGYQIYLTNNDGSLTDLGFTNQTSYNYITTSTANTYKFVIKSTYNMNQGLMSSGLTITVTSTQPSTKPDNNDNANNDIDNDDNNNTTNNDKDDNSSTTSGSTTTTSPNKPQT